MMVLWPCQSLLLKVSQADQGDRGRILTSLTVIVPMPTGDDSYRRKRGNEADDTVDVQRTEATSSCFQR